MNKSLNLLLAAFLMTSLPGCLDSGDSGSDASTPSLLKVPSHQTTIAISGAMTQQEIDDFILALNQHRAAGTTCGSKGSFDPQDPLPGNQKLAEAAQAHSDDQYQMGEISHTGSDGSNPGERITLAGYNWASYAENVASGYKTAEAVAQAWMDSEGHCVNMMSSTVTEVGIATTGTNKRYWTLKLASPNN